MSYYKTAKIISIKDENYRVRTITLDAAVHAQPGQFVMVWLPGVDEKPFCVAQDQPLRLTIAKVGPFTEKLFALKQGDCLSFRGPLGSGFTLPKDAKEILLIGGGYGVAPIRFFGPRGNNKRNNRNYNRCSKKKGRLDSNRKSQESQGTHACQHG